MRHRHSHRDIVRLRIAPEAPEEASHPPRPRGSRRPHTEARVKAVRRLIEQTTLTYGEIAARTGVGRASICRWSRDGEWQRPPFAPRATDTIPRPRASQKLKLRLLAERLRVLAERYVRELEETPGVDLDRLAQALELAQMARLEAMGRRRRRRLAMMTHMISDATRAEVTRKALAELRRAGIDASRAPQEALDLAIDARMPAEEEHPALRARGRR